MSERPYSALWLAFGLSVTAVGCEATEATAQRGRAAEHPWRAWRGWPTRPAHDREAQCPPVATVSEMPLPQEGARLIRAQARWFRRCYDWSAVTRAQLVGTLRVRFTVRCDGTVASRVRMEGLDEAPELRACVKDLLRTLRFEPPHGGAVDYQYPFTFLPERRRTELE
ncbi:MAG: AgmX/PglI C-terminal domain-containing protein [Deltaproteobacteria bacterium]|nr:AgmX/PglI C-terminal domain-containing protein [Deltaproteobacteria bacterium]